LKTRTEVSSPRKKIDDAEREEDVEGNDGAGDRGKKNKKGLWNLFNAEYEIWSLPKGGFLGKVVG
jgi:hypothetical protein